jgi:channel protein (hemolysin III family)
MEIKMDGRLFKDELLYCEGKHKPWFRGKIHLASLVFVPVAVYYISFSNSPWVYFNLFGNVLCFAVSGFYHTFDWSPSTELFLQKLDHQAISLWTVTMMTPIAFDLFPTETRVKFLTILLSAFIANSYATWTSQPSTILASSIPGSLLLFLGECWKHMDSMEWTCMLLGFAFQSSGTVAYVLSNKGYRLCGNDTIFGYHELFHTATLFSAYFVYMVNYTIARAQSPSAPISVASLTQFTEI